MRQRWRDLLFLHFPCEPALVAPLVPPGLTLDTFPDENGLERAWIGLVPFLMKDVRWTFAPPVPGTHTFLETNVRTYVHREGRDPGVWFFSLDAANRLAVTVARVAFSLPYYHARMRLKRVADRLAYGGDRRELSYDIQAVVENRLPAPEPGSLEFFLVERYLLYSRRGSRLFSGRVHHTPYELSRTRIDRVEETLVAAAGVAARPYVHHVFSEGVDVDVFSLRAVT